MSGWNPMLIRKALHDARLLLLSLGIGLFAFSWLFVWLASAINLGALGVFLNALPDVLKQISGVPVAELTTTAGMIAVLYVDPVIVFGCAIWAIARGSDAVSGEIDRGTMELLLSQPVSRLSVLLAESAVTIAGAIALSACVWLGNAIGLATAPLKEELAASLYLPAAGNLFAFTVCLAGITTLLSSADRYRWRTVGLASGFFAIQLVLKLVARMRPEELGWLRFTTILGAYEPQQLISEPAGAMTQLARDGGILLAVGLLCYLLAAIIFCRRDLPAPL